MDKIVDLSYYQWRTLSLKARQEKIEQWKEQGIGVLRLAKVWEISSTTIYKWCSQDNPSSNNNKQSVIDQLIQIKAEMGNSQSVSEQLLSLAIQLQDYEQKVKELQDLRLRYQQVVKQCADLRQQYKELKADMQTLIFMRDKYNIDNINSEQISIQPS